MRRELELRDHAEVAASTAQRPVKVGVLRSGCGDHLSVGGDDPGRDEVVAAEPGLLREPADAAAERQPRDAGVADLPTRHRLPVGLRGRVEVGPRGAGTAADAVGAGIDRDVAHAAEVQHEAVVDGPVAGEAVPAAAHRQLEVVLAGESDRGGDVGGRRCARDDRGPAVDVAVPEAAALVVAGVSCDEEISAEILAKRVERTAGDRDHRALLVEPSTLFRVGARRAGPGPNHHSEPEGEQDHADDGPEALTGHEGALQHADSLEEPHRTDHAQEDTDQQAAARRGTHVCDGLAGALSSSNAISST